MVLAEKIALVTGAGRGMGRAIALQYAQAGAAVAAVDVDGQTAHETSAAIEAAGGRSLPIQADVGALAALSDQAKQGRVPTRLPSVRKPKGAPTLSRRSDTVDATLALLAVSLSPLRAL